MITETLPLAEVTKEALRVLYREIGVVNTIRFVNQFTIGHDDYTEERKALFKDLTLDALLAEIKQNRVQKKSENQ
jgi:hypothetical protein